MHLSSWKPNPCSASKISSVCDRERPVPYSSHLKPNITLLTLRRPRDSPLHLADNEVGVEPLWAAV